MDWLIGGRRNPSSDSESTTSAKWWQLEENGSKTIGIPTIFYVLYPKSMMEGWPGHFARDCRSPAIPAAPVNVVDARPNQRLWDGVIMSVVVGIKLEEERTMQAKNGDRCSQRIQALSRKFFSKHHFATDLFDSGADFIHGERVKESTKALKNAKVDEPKISDISVVREFVKYKWGEEQEAAFQTLKNNLYDAPVLSLPDGMEDFVVYYDASNQGLGCVLMQRDKLVQETIDKVVLIKEKLKAAKDRQKSYADNRRKPLEFEEGDRVMLKVLPWKGVICFGKKGKLEPSYVYWDPVEARSVPFSLRYDYVLYQILERVNCVLRISGLYTSRLLDAACKKVLNLLKKGLLKVEAMSKSAWTEKDQIDNFLKERRFNTTAGNPVKEILLKLNLPDHKSILMDSKEYIKMVMEGKPQQDDIGFVDSGCSRHMTGNIAYLLDFKEFDGGYMCDKKNYVLFTDTECLVLSPNFNLPDESQILLKIPRKDNMYSFNMKNIVPKESLTCLVAKATLDESMLWHRRLGHINFKNINKLVKDNLVRGLPTKRFENDQTCVACLKGKQHRASCKSKVLNPITKPLFMLHMDLFGLTFVNILMHKK
ncbi:putative ribonuclease H-like domain-containing protein [Tanacetum coccineum]